VLSERPQVGSEGVIGGGGEEDLTVAAEGGLRTGERLRRVPVIQCIESQNAEDKEEYKGQHRRWFRREDCGRLRDGLRHF
jgi:hypothetical protein